MSDFDSPDPGPATDTAFAATAGEFTDDLIDAPDVLDDVSAAALAGGLDAVSPNGDGTAPRKRRRRGSRGGRGRKRPGTAATGTRENGGDGGATPSDIDDDVDDEDDDDELAAGGEWSDEAADRGLTDDDLAAQAREDAGLPEHGSPTLVRERDGGPTSARPRIGDSRPSAANAPGPSRPSAPTVRGGDAGADRMAGTDGDGDGEEPKKRRRRRGGRGRSKSGGTGGGNGAAVATAVAPSAPAAKKRTVAGQYVDAGDPLTGVDVDGTALLDSLDDATLLRRQGTRRKGRPAGRYLMVVHQRTDEVAHIAVLEGRTLVEHYVAMPTDDTLSIDGNIYLGRVQNVLPGMEAAFIDIGTPKNGVLYRGDVAFDASDMEGGERPRIERALRNGQSIIVQVTKNPIGHKGARLTQEVSLAGRFVVMVPAQPDTYGISKRLPDDERKRLRRVLDRIRPSDAGLIVRTAAEGATEEELERDLRRLEGQWQQISALAKKAKSGSLLYKEPPLAIRLIREEFTKEYRGVVIDDQKLYEEVQAYVDAIAPELSERIEFFDETEERLPIFEKFHVHEQLHKALDRKVWLPSGGSLVIERTEALTVIDVNTGKNVGVSNLEETVYRNNLEAAEVVARELRLRDIGGIIVIDFIDMESKRNRESVEEAFRDALARDKTRTQVFPISELGLIEMTRKRVSEGLVETFSSTCSVCNGRGFIIDESMLI